MTKAQIQTSLAPHMLLIRESVADGFNRHQVNMADNDDLRAAYGPSVAAHCIHALICKNAAERFAGVAGASISYATGFLVLVFDAGFNIRFKKLDDKRLACHNTTHQSQGLASQDPFLPMPGLPLGEVLPNYGPMLIAGYQTDETETKWADILITCPDGENKNSWWFSIARQAEEEGGATTIITPPMPEAPVISRKVASRIAKSV